MPIGIDHKNFLKKGTIDEIVYLTGFSEPSTFYRAFKRWTQITPIEYRNQKNAR